MTAGLLESTGRLRVSAEAFAAHCRSGAVISAKQGEPALLRHVDRAGEPIFTKIWRARGPFSSDRLIPYDGRFRRALLRLAEAGVPVPEYLAHGRVAGGGTRFVLYRPLPGTALRSRYGEVDIGALGRFVCGLHDKGIYFRGLHLGNVIHCPDRRLGLIDVQDIRFFRRPLSRRRRERNLGSLCAHPGDLAYMLDGAWSELVMAYSRAAGLGVTAAARLLDRVGREMERRRARRAARRRRRGLRPLAVGEYESEQDRPGGSCH